MIGARAVKLSALCRYTLMHLVIGTPGAVASRLVEELANRGDRVILLGSEPALAVSSPNFELIEGDASRLDFGLSGSDYASLLERVSHIFLASEATVPVAEIETAPLVRQALEVNEFVRAGGAPQGVTLLSSLLVFGNTPGPVREEYFQLGQNFASKYEESLALAEKVVRELCGLCPLAILRAGAIVGDERSGTLLEGSGFERLMKSLASPASEAATGHAFSDGATRWETVNRAALALLALPPSEAVCVAHLVDSKALTDRELLEWMAQRTGKTLRESLGPARAWVKWSRASFAGERAFRGWPTHFSRDTAEAHLGGLLDRDEIATLEALFPKRIPSEIARE